MPSAETATTAALAVPAEVAGTSAAEGVVEAVATCKCSELSGNNCENHWNHSNHWRINRTYNKHLSINLQWNDVVSNRKNIKRRK